MPLKHLVTCILFNSATTLVGLYGIHKFADNEVMKQHQAELSLIKHKYEELKKTNS
jgi:hypothetical protein